MSKDPKNRKENVDLQFFVIAASSDVGKETNKKASELPEINGSRTEKIIQEILTKEFKREVMKNRAKKCSIAAVLAIFVISITFNILVFSVSAIRGPVISFFQGKSSDYITNQADDTIYFNHEDIGAPRYVPDEFLTNKIYSSSDGMMVSIEYSNDQNDEILFKREHVSVHITEDTENVTEKEIALSEKQKAVLIQKDNIKTLIWEAGEYYYTLRSNLPIDNLVQIANSVPIK